MPEKQWVRALALQTEEWVYECKLRHTLAVKTGSDRSTAKRSAIVPDRLLRLSVYRT